MIPTPIQQNIDEIISLYKNFGNEDYIGEPVSQIEHMCQCAQLAEASGADDELILALFFMISAIYMNLLFLEKSCNKWTVLVLWIMKN